MPTLKTNLATAVSLICTATTFAGDLNAPSAPTDPGSAMYQLEDVYNRLNDGSTGRKRSGSFVEPDSAPGSTGHTLDDVMSKVPVADNVNGVQPAGALAGETYWSLRTDGGWGLQTGSMPNIGDQDFTPTTTPQTISAGYHDGNGTVAGDANLVEGNIVSGTTIFGVAGTANPYPSPVPRTGQTTCYSATGSVETSCVTLGQDADVLAGEVWPNPRFHKNASGVNDDGRGGGVAGDGICNGTETCNGTVTDNLTGLVWLENASCSIFFAGDVTGSNPRPWGDALTAANGLATGSCGLTDGSLAGDWHLPNRNELNSLLDSEYYGPALSNAAGTAQHGAVSANDAFSGVVSGGYWSSTTVAGNTAYAWIVSLGYGVVGGGTKASSGYVWPVRAGQ